MIGDVAASVSITYPLMLWSWRRSVKLRPDFGVHGGHHDPKQQRPPHGSPVTSVRFN